MADLEYRIGGMDVHPHSLRFEGSNPHNAWYKFVAEAEDNVVSIYVAGGFNHDDIVKKFGVKGQKVGGGSCYLNGENQLVLDDFSSYYDAIPKEVAQRFAELILPELEKLGIKVDGIAVDPMESTMNSYWREKGFSFQ